MLLKFLAPIVTLILDKLKVEQRLDDIQKEGIDTLKAEIPVLEQKMLDEVHALEERVLAMLPLLTATAAKTVSDAIMAKFSHLLDSDPDIPIISDVFDLSETIRKTMNDSHPDVNIPVLGNLGDLFKNFGH